MANVTEFKNNLCKFVWEDVSKGQFELAARSDLNKIVSHLFHQNKIDLGIDLAITEGMLIESKGSNRWNALLSTFNYHLTQADKILT